MIPHYFQFSDWRDECNVYKSMLFYPKTNCIHVGLMMEMEWMIVMMWWCTNRLHCSMVGRCTQAIVPPPLPSYAYHHHHNQYLPTSIMLFVMFSSLCQMKGLSTDEYLFYFLYKLEKKMYYLPNLISSVKYYAIQITNVSPLLAL